MKNNTVTRVGDGEKIRSLGLTDNTGSIYVNNIDNQQRTEVIFKGEFHVIPSCWPTEAHVSRKEKRNSQLCNSFD